MSELTRRSMLPAPATLPAVALTPLAPALTRAAAPPIGKQAPGFYRYKVGAFECTSISDGARPSRCPIRS